MDRRWHAHSLIFFFCVLLGILQMQPLAIWLGTSQAAPFALQTYILSALPGSFSFLPHPPTTSLPVSPPPPSFLFILFLPSMLLLSLLPPSFPSFYLFHPSPFYTRKGRPLFPSLLKCHHTMSLYPPLTGQSHRKLRLRKMKSLAWPHNLEFLDIGQDLFPHTHTQKKGTRTIPQPHHTLWEGW